MEGIERKPVCRLPEVITSSYLIGSTVHALIEAGLNDKAQEFTTEINRSGAISDYHQIFNIALRYVEFK
ncbi:MAG: hypothetical protein N2316_07455 [Spirochaetes bacterium]|nr:hypothetical protein [Spirochaetota bacterium]